MNEFEKWFEQKYGSTFQTCKNPALYKSLEAAFLAGVATGYANGVAVMKERCAEVAEAKIKCRSRDDRRHWIRDKTIDEAVAAIRKMEVER